MSITYQKDAAHPILGTDGLHGVLAGTFAAQTTNGDGARAIHSVFGVLNDLCIDVDFNVSQLPNGVDPE
eukprot:4037147-Karenia_brevis.AAC.1